MPFPQDRSFLLWGQKSDNGSLIIDKENIAYNGGWLSSQTWPESPMTFEAVWPTDLDVEYSKGKGIQIKSFDCTEGKTDILLAKADDDKIIDTLVTLRFDHILSRVDFRISQALPSEMSMRLTKIELKDYGLTGAYNTKSEGEWTVDNSSGSYVVYDAGETDGIAVKANEVEYAGDEFYVIPQLSLARVEVSYLIKYGSSGTWIPQTSTLESLEIAWEPSTHYTYTLTLRTDKLVSTAGISSWNNR